MSPPLVLARFANFRSVPSRGVAVLNMDVPLDRAGDTMDTLGTPRLGESIHVGMVRLQEGPVDEDAPAPPAVHGTFEKVTMVSSRKALTLTVEIPGEQLAHALRLFSIPTLNSFIRIAIARLLEQPPDPPRRSGKTRGEAAVARCAIRTKEEPFQRFILATDYIHGDPTGNDLEAQEAVKRQLGIVSRRVLKEDHEKLKEWEAMEHRYEEWLQNGGLDISVARDAR